MTANEYLLHVGQVFTDAELHLIAWVEVEFPEICCLEQYICKIRLWDAQYPQGLGVNS